MSMSTQHIGPVFKEILDYDKDEWRDDEGIGQCNKTEFGPDC